MEISSFPAAYRFGAENNILIEVVEWCAQADVASIQDYRLHTSPLKKGAGGLYKKPPSGGLYESPLRGAFAHLPKRAGWLHENGIPGLSYPNGNLIYHLCPTGDYRLLWEIKGKFLSSDIFSLLDPIDPIDYYRWSDAQTAFFYKRLETIRSKNCPVALLKSVSGRFAANMGGVSASIQGEKKNLLF